MTSLKNMLAVLAAAGATTLAGCAGMPGDDSDLAQAFADDSGKTDAVKNTKLVDNIAPDSSVEGQFSRRIRVYGYVVEAKRGAKLSIALDARSSADAERENTSAPLDTMMGVWGPFESVNQPGPQLAASEDGNTPAAPPIALDVKEDGRYLIAFSSWEDTGDGAYRLDVSCQGTDFQCRRPEQHTSCNKETLFLQGAQIAENTRWNNCEVVLLETTTVAEGAILTIEPGVVVKGNFLGPQPFGSVQLQVQGALQAIGTAEQPIAFTSLKDTSGWGGLVLAGRSSSLEHVFIEKAGAAVTLLNGASATISDAVIEGMPVTGNQQPQGAGVVAQIDAEATFTRALVHNYRIGLHLANARNIVIQDSVVRDNVIGLQVDGANPRTQCTNPAPPPAVWRDPVIIHSDIINNRQQGVWIRGEDVLLQVDMSNIVGNGGPGVEVDGAALNPESFVRSSNVFGNNGTNPAQVLSFHRQGVLDISGNHWVHISDPELSASWRSPCSGQVSFTGFSPVPIADAGPRLGVLIDPVKQQTLAQQQL